jgi:DHA1 family tetracycline resistance protein-like MFS transporter
MNRLKQPIVPIFIVIFVNMLGIGIILPLLPYYAQTFGADPFTIGVLLGSYAAFQLIGAPILGRMSDRYGRKPVLIVTEGVNVVGYLVMALATGLPMLFAARILAGFMGGNIPVAQAAITDVTDEKSRAKAFGLSGSAFGLGFILGPALGASLAPIGYWLPAAIASVLSLIAMMLVITILPETRKQTLPAPVAPARAKAGFFANLKASLNRPVLAAFLGVSLIYTFAFAVYQNTYVLVLAGNFGLAVQQAGFMLMYGGILIVLMQWFVLPRVVDRLGERRLIPVGMTILATGATASAFVPSWEWLLLTSGLVTVGAAFTNPSMMSLLSKLAGSNERGAVLGVSSSVNSLANIGSPLVGGLMLQVIGGASPMVLTGALVMTALCGIALLFRSWKGSAAPTQLPARQEEAQPSERVTAAAHAA